MINFLPWREGIARRRKWLFILRLTLLPVLVLLISLLALSFAMQYQQQLQRNLHALTSEVKRTQRAHVEATQAAEEQQRWYERVLLIQRHQAQTERPFPIDLLPHKPATQGISLLRFVCELSACEIEGRAQHIHQLSPFMDALSQAPWIHYLQIEQLLPEVNLDSQSSTRFLISFHIRSQTP
ncbi:hypothetical protein [Vibrio ezurae]|uniref:Uncharacterized protein n=1 Tax=Vibrio ezurae NBRC 102218 TaxID=1219080 RepID=U3B563_9VIBR|nr:hypothetical protein [Vibrio ezurae]GAD80577.1 hypothetical protein VEZ01S_37_01420 [Vibrio ezurae NBRC 102218]